MSSSQNNAQKFSPGKSLTNVQGELIQCIYIYTVIDQTSFRTKGTVVVFGLTKLQTNSSPSHWLGREGMREEGWGFGGIS
jgi:hypothetical protein